MTAPVAPEQGALLEQRHQLEDAAEPPLSGALLSWPVPLCSERVEEIRRSVPPGAAPGTLARMVRELLGEYDRLRAELYTEQVGHRTTLEQRNAHAATVRGLRAERHSTNEALSDAAEAVRAKDALLAAVRAAVADALMCPDDACVIGSHLSKLEQILGGVGLLGGPGAVSS